MDHAPSAFHVSMTPQLQSRGNLSRVEGDKRTYDIELRSYFPHASVDVSEALLPKPSPW
jgi:hypothetical protein